tara:strand:- start:17601 stop:18080 length:480 start_codon:yes stop_codon:yes gene_type:complete
MGKRGPQPTPIKLLEKAGSWRAKIKPDVVEAPAERPEPPAWMPEDCLTRWSYCAEQLMGMGILGKIDQDALAQYCYLWKLLEEAIRERDTTGNVDHDPVKGQRISPYFKVVMELSTQVKQLCREFGMTPSSRTAFSAAVNVKDQKKDGLAAFSERQQSG